MLFSWGRLISLNIFMRLCAFRLFLPLQLVTAIASKDNRRVPKNKHGEIKVCCLEELILTERWPLSLHTHSFFYFILFFYQASPKGLIICRALWREKEERCPYHLLPESGRVIGLCKAKWSPVWWLLIKNWLCHIKEELKVKMMITSLSQGPCTISFIQPWKVLSE